MPSVVLAGSAYFAMVFGVGFVLGTLRVTWLAPRLGETKAVFAELPVMLTASTLVAIWLVTRFEVPIALWDRVIMGGVAFGLLMLAELALSTLMMGRTLAAHLAHYGTTAGAVGLAGQIGFALIPALLLLR